MKRISLILCLCLSHLLGMAQYGTQFENRGFENWANFGSGNDTYEPIHWHSGMSASGTFSGFLSKQIEPSNQVRPGSSGTRSVRMWPKSVMGVTANGNLTCGRMNAGSMSASGSSNYNYTQRSDARFNTPINTIPDSLTVWVCFRSASPSQNARARALIHGDADFKEVANGTLDPSDKLVATAMTSFHRTSEANGSYTWRRLSVPFVQNGPCNDPRYILFTITTNEVPGAGGTADDMYVDDILLIYNPSIQMGALPQSHYLIGEELTIPFTLTGTMSPDNLDKEPNQVIAQLSAANGSFSSPTELGRITTNTSGSLTVNIPQGIFTGEHYRIRLVTTNYPMISEDNGFDISIDSPTGLAEAPMEEEALDVKTYDITGKEMPGTNLAPGIYIFKYFYSNSCKSEKVVIK